MGRGAGIRMLHTLGLVLAVFAASCTGDPVVGGAPEAGAMDGSMDVACAAPMSVCSERCVDTMADRAHCGGCGMQCPGAQVCVMGRCAPACPSGQTCESGRCFPSDGCRASMRRGFTEVARFANVAACGARSAWATATAAPSTVCAAGWHPCTPEDVTAVTGAEPDFLASGSFAWVAWVDPAMSNFPEFPVARCAGATPAVSNLRGTGACTASGVFPEGWRLAVDAGNWAWSHTRTGACAEHTIHRCAYPGGAVPQQRGHTLCCRDP